MSGDLPAIGLGTSGNTDPEQCATSVETAIETGDPADMILDYVHEHDVDHVVIGCHGRSGVARWLLGSVAEAVVRRAPVPVTAVK